MHENSYPNPLQLPRHQDPGAVIIFSRSIDRNQPLKERMLQQLIAQEPLGVVSHKRRRIRYMAH